MFFLCVSEAEMNYTTVIRLKRSNVVNSSRNRADDHLLRRGSTLPWLRRTGPSGCGPASWWGTASIWVVRRSRYGRLCPDSDASGGSTCTGRPASGWWWPRRPAKRRLPRPTPGCPPRIGFLGSCRGNCPSIKNRNRSRILSLTSFSVFTPQPFCSIFLHLGLANNLNLVFIIDCSYHLRGVFRSESNYAQVLRPFSMRHSPRLLQ